MSNKVSSKLAAGVRKVKEQRTAAPTAGKPARSEASGRKPPGGCDETPVVETARVDPGTDLHPVRVWPD